MVKWVNDRICWAAYTDDRGWLVDTGVGGTYSWKVDDAMWFRSKEEASAMISAMIANVSDEDVDVDDVYKIVRVA